MAQPLEILVLFSNLDANDARTGSMNLEIVIVLHACSALDTEGSGKPVISGYTKNSDLRWFKTMFQENRN